MPKQLDQTIISITGLGYVGLPIALAFSKKYKIIGFDINPNRIKNLKNGIDNTGESDKDIILNSQIEFTENPEKLKPANFHIVTVPTPINSAKKPDLFPLEAATRAIGKILKKNDTVVFESTVYPGTTESFCVPILEKESGLKFQTDFFVGYSPERINPGDKIHSFENINKIVSGCCEQSLNKITEVYQSIISADIHQAPNIQTAEAAKIIENTQRDLNIALMNELSLIFHRMGIDTQDVLAAAGTKWNFLKFTPGLVGGHCIGVDPYYLTYIAQQFDYHPEVILAGRRINDNMGKYIAECTIKNLRKNPNPNYTNRIAVLGLTFKENCTDIRNTRVIDIINELKEFSYEVLIHDPRANPSDVKKEYNLTLTHLDNINNIDAIIIAVAHDEYKKLSIEDYTNKLIPNGFIIDIKNSLPKNAIPKNINYWSL